jgi:hypothetical protein
MEKLKYFLQPKNLKAKPRSRFFEHAQKKIIDGKFWLISAIPVFFFLYNHLRRRKKMQEERRHEFYLGVAVYSLFSVVAVIFIVFIFSVNIQSVNGFNRAKAVPADAAGLDQGSNNFDQVMQEVEDYTRQNIALLTVNNDAGGSEAVVDSVNFISDNHALVYYHENSDQYLAEEIFADSNHQVYISRFILKNKNGADYSGGAYGGN